MHLSTDVLVVGAGGAGMYAALAAARAGAGVILADKNMIGRGGATVMAQMTVAAALAEQEPDTWEDHLADTLAAGRGLCDESLAEVLCRAAPERMREMDDWGVGWARSNGHISQVMAPGHGRRRCCYVDFLNTGPAVAGTLRKRVGRTGGIRALSNVAITDLVVKEGSVRGALALALGDGAEIGIEAGATVIATGGLTKLYARSSASNNMAGEGYALALRAGAALVDMEFVQFFPIGHLAPRLVGMDPIMWDPFRYKLGGRLLNGAMEEFIDRYGGEDSGRYTATRDLATYAICREVDAGRGSPSGGAWLSFAHLPETDSARRLRAGDRPAAAQRHRSHPGGGRGGTHRALPHGRGEGGHPHAQHRRRPLCGGRGGRRRGRREPAFRQRDQRGAGVRGDCGARGGGICRRPRRRMGRASRRCRTRAPRRQGRTRQRSARARWRSCRSCAV